MYFGYTLFSHTTPTQEKTMYGVYGHGSSGVKIYNV